ncbi:MAG: cation:proton antiporter, partial [Myxococcales bacterium]|nr:cation:proton antiporter [Myxococcales bacterium]
MDGLLLVLGLLVCAAVVSTRTARRWGVPSLVLFVAIGMLVGSSGPGGVPFEDYRLAYDAGTVALAVILLSGGLDTGVDTLKRALAPALALSTVGVVVKMLVMAGLALLLTPLDPSAALLLGAVL